MMKKQDIHEGLEPSSLGRRAIGRDRFDFSKIHPEQLLAEDQAAAFTNMSTSALRNKLQEGNPYEDPSFPRPKMQKGMAKKGSAVGWVAGELMEWNRNLVACDYSRKKS